MNVFVIMNVHMYVYGNCVCSIYLYILVCNCMHACHLLNDINALSEKETGLNRRWSKESIVSIYYLEEGTRLNQRWSNKSIAIIFIEVCLA